MIPLKEEEGLVLAVVAVASDNTMDLVGVKNMARSNEEEVMEEEE